MKNKKALTLALSAGLVVAGFNTAHAADSNDPEAERIRQGFQDQVDELAEANARKRYQDQVDELAEANARKRYQDQVDELAAKNEEARNLRKKYQDQVDELIKENELKKANEEVSEDYLMEYLKPLVDFSKLTDAEKESFERRMRAAQTPGKVYDIYNEAAELNNSRDNAPSEEKVEWTIIFKFPNGHEETDTFEASPEENEDLIAYDKANSYAGSYGYDKDTDTNTITVTFDEPKKGNSTPLVPIEDAEEIEEVTLKGTFHFPGSNGQDATFNGEDGQEAYAKLRDYAYSFEKEFGEPSIMKNDDDTYDIYYDLYVKPVEKEDFTITVKVFKPFAKEDDYYASATFTSDRYDGDYDKAMADVWNWADAQSGPRRYRAEVVNKYEIHIHEQEGEKASIPWTELIPARPIIVDGDDNKPSPVNPTPVDPITPVDPVNPTPVVPIKPVNPVGPTDDEPVVDTTSKEVDDLIKELDDRTKEIQEEMENLDSTITDDNQKPADEDKKPVDDKKPSDEDKKPSNEDDDANAQPSKDKVVVKDIIKEVKEAVRVPAASHNNPKTGVADLSAVAGTLAISMAGIVATRKKND